MRVLIVHQRYRVPGGEERYVANLAGMLERHGHAVERFERTVGPSDGRTIGERISIASEMVHSHASRALLRDVLDRRRPDIAHINNLYPLLSPSVLVELRRRRVPIVMTVHNHRLICPEGTCSRGGRICEKCCGGNNLWGIFHNCRGSWTESAAYAAVLALHRRRRLFHRLVDRFVVPTVFLVEKLASYGYPSDRMVVIPNMVEIPSTAADGKGDHVLYFGRLSRGKGVASLVKAGALSPEVPVTIAGDGEMRGELESLARGLGATNVRFTGHLDGDRLSAALDDAAFTVVPSECYENCPYAVLESFARGRAVVASRIGGLPEIVREGRNGLLAIPGDAGDLATKIRLLWKAKEQTRRMGDLARRYCEERFSADGYEARLRKVYEAIVG